MSVSTRPRTITALLGLRAEFMPTRPDLQSKRAYFNPECVDFKPEGSIQIRDLRRQLQG